MHKFRLIHTVILTTAFLILTTSCHAEQIFAVVRHTANDITIINLDKFTWTDVEVTINGGGGIFSPSYSYKIAKFPGQDIQGRTIPLTEFVQPNGTRFDPSKTALVRVSITCKVPKSWSNWFGKGEWEGIPEAH